MTNLWSFLLDENNRNVLVFLGGGVAALATAVWALRKEALSRRARVRKEASQALKEFLVPVQNLLEQTRRMQDALIKDTKLEYLEFAPDNVQRELKNHPDLFQRATWKKTVGRLFEYNDKIIELIEKKKFYAINNTDLMAKLDDFNKHATSWKDLWQIVYSDKLAPDGRDKLKAPEFPESLDSTLQAEIDRRRAQLN
jgi:hypothetical protein